MYIYIYYTEIVYVLLLEGLPPPKKKKVNSLRPLLKRWPKKTDSLISG